MIDLSNVKLPESVAIILDGNGRYATKNKITKYLGHKAGCDNLENILEETVRLGIKYLTVYAFSTENWKRSDEEINGLFDLFNLYLNKIKEKVIKNKIAVRFIGDISKFDNLISPEVLINKSGSFISFVSRYFENISSVMLISKFSFFILFIALTISSLLP